MRCTRMKKVYSRVYRKRVKRCAKYSGRPCKSRSKRSSSSSSARRSYSSSSARSRNYRKGRPFNKGKRCKAWGQRHDVRTGLSARYCRSYGSKSAWRSKRRRAAAPQGQRIQVRYAQPYPPMQQSRPAWYQRLLGSGS